ncbi:sugar phosphate isomerase/epimerase family protein [Algoriphagus zhangzhouensis]|uniref:D-psicose/D-tagatose/L-ribulose 3-epimerase n=1 Tax=Algoriphagus zhangzhouensis TaxID=1073327 RepID=A0A1M7Z4X8_9BACT|nr:sugar phosphate isomerase/epimerase family protein [Algoriphagus zhangzhouensis]TDY48818.1 D-tagatose 3-epimerase [Algoriphagus zhangzhouensis]SHO60003.1 D-psicose/D-tagatose/L-ribulose 3-epimerase [Algoriphagus zhangzhouensis]
MALDVKFGVSTWLWTSPFSSETIALFPKIKEYGYDAVEIPVEDPDLIDIPVVADALASNGLAPIICGAFGPTRDLTNEDPKFHQTCFDYLDRCFDIAAQLGAGFVAGPMYSAVGKARLVSPEQKKIEWNLAVTNLRKVCERARVQGLEIAIETLNRFETDLINTAAELKQLITDINEPEAKALLDGFHMNIEEPSIEEAIKTVGDKLIHVQVSENYRGTPGTGQTNWAAWKRGLEAVNYKGTISIESFTPEVKELAGAVCIWKPLVPSQDGFAKDGYTFLKSWASE